MADEVKLDDPPPDPIELPRAVAIELFGAAEFTLDKFREDLSGMNYLSPLWKAVEARIKQYRDAVEELRRACRFPETDFGDDVPF